MARLLPPSTAARLLCLAAVLAAVTSTCALTLLACAVLPEATSAVGLSSWSIVARNAPTPVPHAVSLVAAVALGVLAARFLHAIVRQARDALVARRLCGALGGGPGELVVVDDLGIDVFAVPARRGRIVASRGLLESLSPDERRAVLAHEHAHLSHRHRRYRLTIELVVALNPLLRPLVGAVRYATERWADEAAACALGDRALVARSLARAGLRAAGTPRHATWAAALHMTGGSSPVIQRVEALLAPAPRRRPLLVCAVALFLVLVTAVTVEAHHDAGAMFAAGGVTDGLASPVTAPPG